MVRDKNGRFVKGHTAPGPGRPSRAADTEYLGVVKDVVPLERFARILEKHAAQAERGNIPSFTALIKLLGLEVQRVDQHNDGELLIRVVYERSNDKTARTA